MISFLKKHCILAVLFFLGCATMNQSECLNANWQMIGFEDGSEGLDLSHIGNHRKACAEFNVSPDLNQYKRGHNQGLQQYCTYSKGFKLGSSGHDFNSICPPELEDDFLLGHQRGYEIHILDIKLDKTEASITEISERLDELGTEILAKEGLIISSKTREVDRALLLLDIKEIQTEISSLEVEIELFRQDQYDITNERDLLKQQYQVRPR